MNSAFKMSPIAFGRIVGMIVDAVILYPVQAATNPLAYETGLIAGKDVLKVGLSLLVLSSLVILFIAPPWVAAGSVAVRGAKDDFELTKFLVYGIRYIVPR